MAENSSPPYCETTDLYLQLLGDAQRVEDQRVIRMVLRKLKNYGYSHGFGDADGDVIPFPGSTRIYTSRTSADLFWKDIFFWQNLVQFLVLLIVGATWLTLPFFFAALLING